MKMLKGIANRGRGQYMKHLYMFGVLLIPLFFFISLSLILIYTGNGLTEEQIFPILSGVLAYAVLLFEILLAARPHYLETYLGLPKLYAIHGIAALVILAVTFVHAGSAMTVAAEFETWPIVRPTGSLRPIANDAVSEKPSIGKRNYFRTYLYGRIQFLFDCACLFSKRNTDITSNIAKTQH